jgi:phage shock protein A
MITLIVGALIVFGGILVVFPKSRVLLKGMVNVFIEDAAKTPEGAKAVYNEAIDQKKKDYTRAADTLQKFTGALETAKNNQIRAEKDLKNAEHQCDVLMSQNNEADAQIMVQEVMLHRKEIETYSAQVAKLTPAVEEARNIATTFQKDVKELQVKREMNVKDLELNIQNKELYDSLDELRHSKPINNLLKSVEEGIVEKREIAVGAREVHENKLTTKIDRINTKVADVESDNYLASLRDKYKK